MKIPDPAELSPPKQLPHPSDGLCPQEWSLPTPPVLLLAPHLALGGQMEAVDGDRGGSELLAVNPWIWEVAVL